jgi:hypothetical protein
VSSGTIAFSHGRIEGCICTSTGHTLFTDFENFTKFKPAPFQEKAVNTMLDEVVTWGGALKTLRTKEG